jgi:hypothetical protein
MVEQNGQGGTEEGQSHGEGGGVEQEQEQAEQETKENVKNQGNIEQE